MTRGTATLVTLAAVLIVGAGLAVYFGPDQSAADAADLYRRARLAAVRGEFTEAEDLARAAIDADESMVGARLLAAECSVELGHHDQALLDISSIPLESTADWLKGRKLAAEVLHYRVGRFTEAEENYREILKQDPDDPDANDGYARLLGLCGRRSEAIPHVLRLIRAGRQNDLLILLSRVSGSLSDPDLLEQAHTANPRDPLPLLGLAKLAASEQKSQLALQHLMSAASLEAPLPPAFDGMVGQQLLENKRWAELIQWAEQIDVATASSESFAVLGAVAEQQGDVGGAIRCYWEACRLQPESLPVLNQLARLLAKHEHPELAAPFLKRISELNGLRDAQRVAIMSGNEPDISELLTMIEAYRVVGRFWETLAWARVGFESDPQNQSFLRIANEVAAQIPEESLELTVRSMNPAFIVDLSEYPFPETGQWNMTEATTDVSRNIRFVPKQSEIGFDFQFFNGSDRPTRRMFEFGGGGIAAVDFDRDGAPDLFCSQGILFDKGTAQNQNLNDQLFRNIRGLSFAAATEAAGLVGESGFGQGVAVGDIDNDGFEDLYVANLHGNVLWLNNGDGTFRQSDFAASPDATAWTTSCLIADVNHDGIPDLYDVNYLQGDDIFDRLCQSGDGEEIMCSPYDFDAARDRLWIGLGDGRFADRTDVLMTPAPDGKGLGIVAFNNGDDRLSLFISNDTVANFYFRPDATQPDRLADMALQSGLAFNGEGKAEACMGIAAADCTGDGRVDLLVTNFLYESNTLYSPVDESLFADITRDSGLHEPSLPVLGWGTQFLDANMDGRLELFVANGYTQDLSASGTPHKMRPQMFEWKGSRFHSLTATHAGEWLNSECVARSAAKLDWNRDGRTDVAVGVLHEPSFLLTNESSASGHCLSVRLVATKSARDGVGTIVTVTIDGQNSVHQLTAGDGYQASNQRILQVGCGSAEQINQMTIRWPSGELQTIRDLRVPADVTVVQGQRALAVNPD